MHLTPFHCDLMMVFDLVFIACHPKAPFWEMIITFLSISISALLLTYFYPSKCLNANSSFLFLLKLFGWETSSQHFYDRNAFEITSIRHDTWANCGFYGEYVVVRISTATDFLFCLCCLCYYYHRCCVALVFTHIHSRVHRHTHTYISLLAVILKLMAVDSQWHISYIHQYTLLSRERNIPRNVCIESMLRSSFHYPFSVPNNIA